VGGRASDFRDDDPALVSALRAGDDAAFAWLLDRYDSSLRRTALMYVPSRAVADEVVQETWLGVIKGIDRFEGRSSLKTSVELQPSMSRRVTTSRWASGILCSAPRITASVSAASSRSAGSCSQ
jgi:hypothetical protein